MIAQDEVPASSSNVWGYRSRAARLFAKALDDFSGASQSGRSPSQPEMSCRPTSGGLASEWILECIADHSSKTSSETFFSVVINASSLSQEAAHSTLAARSEAAVTGVLCMAYSLDEMGRGREAARELMYFVEMSLRVDGPVQANNLLANADIEKLGVRSLIGLIRSTARMRELLPAWSNAYMTSRVRAQKLGKNPDSVFIGL